MQLAHGTAIRERESRYSFAGRDTPRGQYFSVLTGDVMRHSVAFCFVVKVNSASVERNDMTNFVDQPFQRVFYVEGRAKSSRDLIQRIYLAVRILNLVVRHVTAAFPGLHHIDIDEMDEFPFRCRR